MTAPILPADDPDALDRAAALLTAGGLVAIPTETVYGLAANAADAAAVARVFAAKDRPSINPLIAHVEDGAAADRHGVFAPLARRLAEAFWPGPLTLVLPRRRDSPIALLACAGLDTVALRVPAHAAAQAVLRRFGGPLAAPSANPSGRLSPTDAAAVAAGLGDRVDLILDGGRCAVGIESSVVAVVDGSARLLRPGGVPREALAAVAGAPLLGRDVGDAALRGPGLLASHYAPRARLRLAARQAQPGEAFLGFGLVAGPAGAPNLSPTGDLSEAAQRLFACLRALDQPGTAVIAVAPIPEHGLGEAINDRLARAAADR